MDVKALISKLFSFDHFVAWWLFKIVHALVQVVVALVWLVWIIWNWNSLGWILLWPIVFIWIRLLFEFMWVIFSINSKLWEIKDLLKEQNKQIKKEWN